MGKVHRKRSVAGNGLIVSLPWTLSRYFLSLSKQLCHPNSALQRSTMDFPSNGQGSYHIETSQLVCSETNKLVSLLREHQSKKC